MHLPFCNPFVINNMFVFVFSKCFGNNLTSLSHLKKSHVSLSAALFSKWRLPPCRWLPLCHYRDVIKDAMASQITSFIVSNHQPHVHSGADQRENQNSASLAFVWGIHQWPVNSPHKWPVTWKMFPFYDVISFGISWRIWMVNNLY